MEEIEYLIPNVGPVRIPLYPPADEIYRIISQSRERSRLTRLRHVGTLQYAYPGVSHSRWDYTVAMLYIATRLRELGAKSEFMLGQKKFSSVASVVQCLALLSNIGHLPGTYAVEKGIVRFLSRQHPRSPLSLIWDRTCERLLNRGDILRERYCRQVLSGANDLLNERDYLSLSRVFGLLKLIDNFEGRNSVPNWIVEDLYAPFFIHRLRPSNVRWHELDNFFDVARRLAYLNQDTTLVNSPVTVSLSPILSNLADHRGLTPDALLQSREILAAYEHLVYERFYHSPEARKVATIATTRILTNLESKKDPATTIMSWLYEHNLARIMAPLGIREDVKRANIIGSVSVRSFFSVLPNPISRVENELAKSLGIGVPDEIAVGVQKYVPPDTEHSMQPDHLYLDAFVLGPTTTRHIGRLIRWIADELDRVSEDSDDVLALFQKPVMARMYADLFSRLFYEGLEGARIRIIPWQLRRLGKFADRGDQDDDVGIWLTSSNLDDKMTRHVLRRPIAVPPGYKSVQNELHGLSQLRTELRRENAARKHRRRNRLFLITGSVLIRKNVAGGKKEAEFDGALLRVSARSGAARVYLLETKSAKTPTHAGNVLDTKLRRLNINPLIISRLKSRSAYAVIVL